MYARPRMQMDRVFNGLLTATDQTEGNLKYLNIFLETCLISLTFRRETPHRSDLLLYRYI